MSAEALISRLEGVRQRGAGRWIARCPAHVDKSPSLVVTEDPEGKTLIYCHAQCGAAAVLAAVGLEFTDLFPKDWKADYKHKKRTYLPAQDVLAALDDEFMEMAFLAAKIMTCTEFTEADCDRIALAMERLQSARRMIGALPDQRTAMTEALAGGRS